MNSRSLLHFAVTDKFPLIWFFEKSSVVQLPVSNGSSPVIALEDRLSIRNRTREAVPSQRQILDALKLPNIFRYLPRKHIAGDIQVLQAFEVSQISRQSPGKVVVGHGELEKRGEIAKD
ncbi:hypothetical protein IEQ34_012754 [Dendrobium chrysotoxum]|uniref:Uncharacterized protein n=1 Tax=Dendrobium chrysotoxum TaxID=161865 RepID=A0AAV7G6J4_DENCH|nr:hypothetical protein IEQ34_012754 [Dendrobium chrysotoxum]